MKHIIIIILIMSVFNTHLSSQELEKKASEIHKKILKIDTHLDTPLRLNDSAFNIAVNNISNFKRSKVDIPRILEGNMNALFFAAFVGQRERTPETRDTARFWITSVIKSIGRSIRENSEFLLPGLNSQDAERAFNEDKIAIYCGIENGFAIGTDLSLIKYFYDFGARYITLCHTKNNDICDSSTDPAGPEHNGLSEFGKEIIKEMNRLGMLIDISHTSDKTSLDVIELSRAPVFASHTCCRALANNPRNIPDEILFKIKEKGGVVQICFYSGYLKNPEPQPERDSLFAELKKKYGDFNTLPPDIAKKARAEWYEINEKFPPPVASVKDVVDHIDHVVKTIGIDYVGIGTDFDGGGGLSDCKDISGMQNVTLELLKRGYTERDIEKIWSGNFFRVFRAVEELKEK